MKVLYVTADYFGESSAISVRSRFNVKTLIASGFDTEVLTASRQGVITNSPHPAVHCVDVVGSFSDGGFVRRMLTELNLGLRFAARVLVLHKGYGLVVLTSPPFFANAICAMTCSLVGTRYVLDVRDRYPQVLFDLKILTKTGMAGRLLAGVERSMYQGAFAVQVATRALKAQIERDLPATNVSVQRNGYDADAFDVEFRCNNRSRQKSRSHLRIVMHGLFGRLFDAESFLKIVAYCASHAASHEFVLAGYGPELDAVIGAGFPTITYLGQLNHADMLRALGEVDVGLSVHSEQAVNSFPVKVFEYIGAGVPCIVIPRSEAGIEVDEVGLGWSFDSSQWLECAQKLVELSHNPDLLKPVVERIAAHRHQFSRQHQARTLIDAVARCQAAVEQGRYD